MELLRQRTGIMLGWVLWSVAVGCGSEERPDAPVATLNVGADTLTGEANLSFVVRDPQARLVNVSFFYGTQPTPSSAATPAAESSGIQGLATSAHGLPYTFVWDTVTDLGYERTESVYLSLQVTAGAVSGIGDRVGPLVVDNQSLPQSFDIDGVVRRSPVILGSPAADLSSGTLWISLFTDSLSCPPLCTPVGSPQNLGEQDFNNALSSPSVPFAFSGVPAGTYKIVALFDIDGDAFTGGCLFDVGDLINGNDMSIDVGSDITNRSVVLNYGIEQQCP